MVSLIFHENDRHECDGGIEKLVSRITDWHHEACRVMTVIPRDGFFYRLMDSFSCSPFNTAFLYLIKGFPEYTET